MAVLERGMLYLLLFLSQFTGVELFNPRIGRIALEVILKYLMLIIALFPVVRKRDARFFIWMSGRTYYIYLFIVITLLRSILSGAGIPQIIGEAYDYIFPLSMYLWVAKEKFNKKEILYFIWTLSIIAGVVSVLIAIGVMQVDLWHAAGELVRTATFIDGSMAIFIILICIFYLLTPNNYSKQLNVAALIAGIVTLVLGLSRSRMVIAALLIIIEIILIIPKVRPKRVIKLFLVIIAIGILIKWKNPQLLDQIMETIRKRFMQLASDTSSSFRSIERNMQMEEFKASPVIGKGWGIRGNYNINGSIMYNHCMYTAMLFHGGLLFGGSYLLFFFSILLSDLKAVIVRKEFSERYLTMLILLAIFLLGYASAGIAQGGAVLALLLVFQIEKEAKESLRYSKDIVNKESQ